METRIYMLVFLTCVLQRITASNETFTVRVGAILSSKEMEEVFYQSIRDTTLPDGVRLEGMSMTMVHNPIKATIAMCDNVLSKPNVFAIIVSHSDGSPDQAPITISYTLNFYHIPLIGITSRDSIFSDKEIHKLFLRTVPPYSYQSDIWVDIALEFEWKSVVFIHSNDPEGQAMLSRFQNKAVSMKIEVSEAVSFTPGETDYTKQLQPLKKLNNRIILLYASKEDAQNIYDAADKVGLTGESYGWLVTEQALDAPNTPKGVLGLKLDKVDEAAHIRDSMKIMAAAIRKLYNSRKDLFEGEIENYCSNKDGFDDGGLDMYSALRAVTIDEGETGHDVSFNSAGDRRYAQYHLVNARGTDSVKDYIVGSFNERSRGELNINKDAIIWPGGTKKVPISYIVKTELKIVTIEETPFLRTRKMDPTENQCKRHFEECKKLDSQSCRENPQEVYCPRPQPGGGKIDYCCYGYFVDMLFRLVKELQITFELYQVQDNLFGSFDYQTPNATKKEWNGMVKDLLDEKADMIIAPLTINSERLKVIDFSKPFKYQGLTILVKKNVKESSLGSFLQPFEKKLWILVAVSVHVVALVLYLLDRFSPFGQFKLAKANDTEEDALNLSTAVWFAWGVLLNSGIGEGTPRSFSARVLGMVWAGFAMIIVASYTANLAAFLVLDRPTAPISGRDDPRLRNPQDDFKYATVKGSAVEQYFKGQVELSTMSRTMENNNVDKASDGIQQVINGQLKAFIWDASRLTYEAANHCELLTAGELFGKSSYGIGMRKGSPWLKQVSLTILAMHEDGFMEGLDNRWILNDSSVECKEIKTSPATLGLTNMAGVFMMVAGGIGVGVILIFVEIAYKHYRGIKDKERELARMAANRWRCNIEKRKILRQTVFHQQMDLTLVKENETVENTMNDTSSELKRNNLPPDSLMVSPQSINYPGPAGYSLMQEQRV